MALKEPEKPLETIKIDQPSFDGAEKVKATPVYLMLYKRVLTYDAISKWVVRAELINSDSDIPVILNDRVTVEKEHISSISRSFDNDKKFYSVSVGDFFIVNIADKKEADDLYDKLVMWRWKI